jgi:serine/threonine protein kinase/WD40 repeat protein
MTAGASCPRCHQLLDEVPATGICPHCGAPLARPGTQSDATQDFSSREIDETILTDDAWDSPTLPPGGPNTDVASGAEQAGQPPDGKASEAPGVGTKVRYFGDYELLEEIARGGMGVVYKARQVGLDRVVALKMILAGQLASETDVQRFHTEAAAAAKLDHPGIVPVHEVGEHQGQHYFSMGYVEGQSLADKLVDGPLPPREAAELTKKLAEAVAYAHEEGVIHRDLKPANVLLDKSGQPRITDFGLAKKLEADSHLTGTGQILGTPSYMPPEQAAGTTAEVGPATDVYALGAVLYALTTGRPPFQAANPMDTLLQVMEKEPVPVRQLDAAIPRDLETICLKCLEKSPERRYVSAQELRDELGRFLDDEPIRARPISQTVRVLRWCSRRPAIAATSSLLLLSLILGAGLVTWQWRRAEIARDRAQSALAVARSEQKKADLARHKAQLLSASLAADQGIRHCQGGDLGAGMLWLARGLMNIPSDAVDLEYDLRANLGGWYRNLHRLHGLLEHDGPVSCVVFSPDGTMVLTGSRDGSCRLWKVNSGAPVGSELKHASSVSDVAFSPDGKLFVTATDSEIVRVWDASNGEEARPPIHVGTAAPKIAISARGRLLTAGPGGECRLWDIESGTPVGEPVKAHVAITAVACHPTRDQFVTVGDEIQLRFWETSTARPLGDPVQTTGAIAIAFSPDGSRFATGHTASFSARLWDTASRRPVPIPDGAKRQGVSGAFQHKSWVVSVAFSPDGARLLTGSRDGTSRLWNVRTGQPIGPPLQHGTAVRDVAFNADGQTVATVSQDSFARLWELGPGSRPAITMRQPGAIRAVAFSPDGQTVLAGGEGSIVRRWNAANGKSAGPALSHDGPVRDVAFCPDGKKFLTSD